MKAARFYGGKDIRVEELPDPSPGPGEVLVRVGAAGICGSDLHGYRRPRLPSSTPRTPGHELAGVVVEVGEGVFNLQPGHRVGIEPLIGCKACEWCACGQYHLCPKLEHIGGARSGGFAELTVVPAEKCYKLPNPITLEEAATLDCAAVAVHALHRVPVEPWQRVVVFGTGAIGLYTVQVAKAYGAKHILVVGGRREEPIQLAKELGAEGGILSGKQPPVEAIWDWTNGRGAEVVFETVGGTSPTFDLAVQSVAPGGRLGVIGCFTQEVTFDPRPAMRREISVHWCWSYTRRGSVPEYQIALDMLTQGQIHARPLITHRFSLEEIASAFEVANHKGDSGAIKVILCP